MFQRHKRGRDSWIGRKSSGPLIVMNEQDAPEWTGANSAEFDRAKSIEDYLAVLSLGTSDALVLGDEPFETTWVPLPSSGGGMFVRRLWSKTPADALRAAHGIEPGDWSFDTRFIEVTAERLVLFDAARPGSSPAATISIELPRGRYAIATADAEPDDQTCIMAHRLVPVS